MRILITGGRGQLGRDCREVFANHTILALDLPNLDITSEASVDGVIDLWKPDAIVNCAAYTAVDRAEHDETKAYAANRDGPRLLASRAKARDLFLVHISTDYVFPGNRPVPEPWVETDTPAPASVYGKSKLAGERELDVDGVRYDWPDWWFNVRKSNTEPYLRLIAEAKTPELLAERKAEIEGVLAPFVAGKAG